MSKNYTITLSSYPYSRVNNKECEKVDDKKFCSSCKQLLPEYFFLGDSSICIPCKDRKINQLESIISDLEHKRSDDNQWGSPFLPIADRPITDSSILILDVILNVLICSLKKIEFLFFKKRTNFQNKHKNYSKATILLLELIQKNLIENKYTTNKYIIHLKSYNSIVDTPLYHLRSELHNKVSFPIKKTTVKLPSTIRIHTCINVLYMNNSWLVLQKSFNGLKIADHNNISINIHSLN
ncbi:MAG: hypothetical protein ACPKPY_05840 [Nitrososphaeraceae archaeon]